MQNERQQVDTLLAQIRQVRGDIDNIKRCDRSGVRTADRFEALG